MSESTRQSQAPAGLPLQSGLWRLSFRSETEAWLASAAGLFATNDGGRSWRRIPVATLPDVGDVEFLSSARGYVIVTGSRPALLATEDGGASWRLVYPATFPPRFWFQPLSDIEGVAAGTLFDPGAILRTGDGGQSWQQVGSLGGEGILALSFPDPQHGWALVQSQRGRAQALSRTTDGGTTWAPLPPVPAEALTLSFVDARVGYLQAARGQLYTTRDGGETFTPVSPERVSGDTFPQVAFVSADAGWRINGLRLQGTSDGGRTWTPIPLDCWVKRFALLPSGRAWVIADDCGAGPNQDALLTTGDGGATWTRVNLGANPFGLIGGGAKVFSAEVAFADADHGWVWWEWGYLYRTEDGGRTWVQVH